MKLDDILPISNFIDISEIIANLSSISGIPPLLSESDPSLAINLALSTIRKDEKRLGDNQTLPRVTVMVTSLFGEVKEEYLEEFCDYGFSLEKLVGVEEVYHVLLHWESELGAPPLSPASLSLSLSPCLSLHAWPAHSTTFSACWGELS